MIFVNYVKNRSALKSKKEKKYLHFKNECVIINKLNVFVAQQDRAFAS